MPRQAVPGAAEAGDQVSAVADWSDGKGPRVDNGMNDAPENPAWSVRSALIQPKIEHIADVIIASIRRQFEEPEGKRPETPGSGGDSGWTAHIVME